MAYGSLGKKYIQTKIDTEMVEKHAKEVLNLQQKVRKIKSVIKQMEGKI